MNWFLGESWWFTWIGLPFLIMAARAADQTLGAMRIVFVAKGLKYLAPLVGFVESIIWLVAVSQILQHVNKPWYFVAYGLGYAIGNYIGITVEEKLSLGRVIVRLVTTKDTAALTQQLRENNFGLTVMHGQGGKESVQLLFSVIERKHLNDFAALVKAWDPAAFYSVEEVKLAREGIFKSAASPRALIRSGLRKSK